MGDDSGELYGMSKELKCPTYKDSLGSPPSDDPRTWYPWMTRKLEDHFQEKPQCRP